MVGRDTDFERAAPRGGDDRADVHRNFARLQEALSSSGQVSRILHHITAGPEAQHIPTSTCSGKNIKSSLPVPALVSIGAPLLPNYWSAKWQRLSPQRNRARTQERVEAECCEHQDCHSSGVEGAS